MPPVAHREANGDGIRQRIDHLENLVKKLITERQQVAPPSNNLVYTPESSEPRPSDAQDVVGAGTTVMDGIHSVYVGGDDWHAVLQEVPFSY
jgi:hypothetical protein